MFNWFRIFTQVKRNIFETINLEYFGRKLQTANFWKTKPKNRNFKIGAREINFEIQKLQNSSFTNILKLFLKYQAN